MKTPLQHFSTRRLDAWQGEWEFLQQSVAREPEAAQAWWWKLRLRVLTFVIRRYGADQVVRARDYALEPRETGVDLTFGERRTVEPRPREALGAHLQSIAKENDFPRPPTMPDEDDQKQRKQIEGLLTFAVGAIAICCTVMILGNAIDVGGKVLVGTVLLGFFLLLVGTVLLLTGTVLVLAGTVAFMVFDPLLKRIGRWLKEK